MPSRVPDALQIPSAFLAPPVPPGTHFIQARLPIPLRHPVFTPLSCPYSASLPVFPFPSLTPRRPGKSRAGCHRPADTVPGLSRAPFPAPALAGARHRAAKEPCRQLAAPYQAAPYTVPGLSRAPFPAPALAGAVHRACLSRRHSAGRKKHTPRLPQEPRQTPSPCIPPETPPPGIPGGGPCPARPHTVPPKNRAAKEPCRQLTAPYQAAPHTVPPIGGTMSRRHHSGGVLRPPF